MLEIPIDKIGLPFFCVYTYNKNIEKVKKKKKSWKKGNKFSYRNLSQIDFLSCK